MTVISGRVGRPRGREHGGDVRGCANGGPGAAIACAAAAAALVLVAVLVDLDTADRAASVRRPAGPRDLPTALERP
ncbi:hypothetical protein ACFYZJ_15630 [Streptomyces sp. NPDC001848]|uniref:hypothetical protein n=1 Tax=Streptomyces sp. NPDC001848 TaxID=3364618 RepID=UPI00369C4DE6